MFFRKIILIIFAFFCFSFNGEETVISVIEDSQVGNVSRYIPSLASSNERVTFDYKVGSSIQYWNGQRFSASLSNTNPKEVIIFLGSNNYDSQSLPDVTKILSEIQKRNIKCTWVGPPKIFERPWRHNEKLKLAVEGTCKYFDSQNSGIILGDRIHPAPSSAKLWAELVWKFRK